MSFTIEKDKAIPTATGASKPARYPFGQMEIGDSFLVPASDEPGCKNVSSAASRFANATGPEWRFISRTMTVEKDGEAGVRVWRVDPAQYPKTSRPRKPQVESMRPKDAVGF